MTPSPDRLLQRPQNDIKNEDRRNGYASTIGCCSSIDESMKQQMP